MARKIPIEKTLSRTLSGEEIQTLLTTQARIVTRMAAALTGTQKAGGRVLRWVMSRAVAHLEIWTDTDQAASWCWHHAVLASRRHAPATLKPKDDLLIPPALKDDPQYVAFVRAVRLLPQQQMEAFILSTGEAFNPRNMGIAMDCSTAAAQTHLSAAQQALRTTLGEALEPMTEKFRQVYRSLAPNERLIGQVNALRRRHVAHKRLLRLADAIAALALLAAVAAGAWWLWRAVEI